MVARATSNEIKQQTSELFKQYREANDESTKIFIENEIILINFNLALHKSKRYRHTCLDDEDIVAAATAGLFLAVRSYDHTKASFATYARHVMDSEINQLFRKAGRKKRTALTPLSLDKESSKVNADTWMDRLIDERAEIEPEYANRLLFQELINICAIILDEIEFAVLKNSLLPKSDRKSHRELGVMFSRGRTTINRTEKKAIKKLRDYIVEQGWGLELLRG